MKRVVITGMGVVSPIGNNVEEVWTNVKQNVCGIDRITHFDPSEYRAKLAGEVKNLDMEQYFTKRDLKFNDRFTQFARIAAKQAYEDSGLQDVDFDHDRFGVILGSALVEFPQLKELPKQLKIVDQAEYPHILFPCH